MDLKKAVILAGGQGTRLKPITYELPKSMIPIHGKPLLAHLIDLFKKYDVKDIFISVGYLADRIKDNVKDGSAYGINVRYFEEKEPLGTAGPLKQNKDKLTETFFCTNGDELKKIDLKKMYAQHKETGALATLALYKVEDPSAYGVAKLEGNKIVEFIEKPKKEEAPSNLINAGFYILEPEVLDMIPDGFAMLETDVFPKIAKMGKLYGFAFDGPWFDAGTFERYEIAINEWIDIE